MNEQLSKCTVSKNSLIKSYSDVLNGGYPTLNKIKTELGEETVLGFLKLHILDLRVFLNIGKSMTDAQTEQTALLILDEFPVLTIADIKLFFTKIKKGHYGQIYDRLDGQLLLIWIAKYFEERCDTAELETQKQSEEHKKQSTAILSRDEVRKVYEKMQAGTYIEPKKTVDEEKEKNDKYLKVKAEYEKNRLLSNKGITPTQE